MINCIKAAAVTALLILISCSAADNTKVPGDDYQIEYSVGGGFTGIINGITINSNGEAKFWERIASGSFKQKDSLKLNDKQLKSFCTSLQDTSIYTYRLNDSGNITTTLAIKFNEFSNKISYMGTEPPAKLPQKLIELVNQIKKLYSQGEDRL